jgi:hypothetical protein
MPWNEVMSKFKHGGLRSGSKTGPAVRSRAQAVAIMLSEKREAEGGKDEYAAKGVRRHRAKKALAGYK